jgi:hypothetical protein
MAYYQAENTGIGFITHDDNETSHISSYPGNIWVTENTAWAQRVNAIEKTKEEAQALVDAELVGQVYPEIDELAGQQVIIILP